MNNSSYIISSAFVVDSKVFDCSSKVKSLNILADYNEYVFPVIYLDIMLNLDEFKAISESNNKRIKLSLARFEGSEVDNTNVGTYEYCFRDKIFCIVNEDNYYLTQPTNSDMASTLDAMNYITARFILIQEDDLNANKENISGCYSDCTPKALLSYMMNRLNQNKKVIIAEPNNNTVIHQVLIPFNTILNTFEYLDTVYGFYIDGIKVFCDLDTNYVLNKNHSNFNNELLYDTVIIDIPSAGTVGTYDLKKNTITVFGKDFAYSQAATLRNELTGTNNAFVLNNENKSILNQTWETGVEKKKVYYQKYSNPYLGNQLTPENNMDIVANCQNANYNLINFANEFVIKEYKQNTFKEVNLILKKYNHKFVRTRDTVFELYTSMSFKKI